MAETKGEFREGPELETGRTANLTTTARGFMRPHGVDCRKS
jgi:hypothetical protein